MTNSNSDNVNSSHKDEDSLKKFVQELETINKKYDEKDRLILESMQIEFFKEKSDEAIKTLNRVSQEWFSGKQKIQWRVMTPNSKNRQYLTPVGITIFFMIFAFTIWLDYDLGMLYFLFILIFAIILFIILWKNEQYSKTKVTIYRNKRKGIFIENNRSKRIKYGKDFTLKAFRLSENSSQLLKKTRIQLQKAITAETGWNFDNHWEYMTEQEKRAFMHSSGFWKSEYDNIEKFLKSSGHNPNYYDDIS